MNTITHGDITVTEGDVLYIPDNIHPVTVLALYRHTTARAVLDYAGTEIILDAATLLSRINNGHLAPIGHPLFAKGMRFRQPTTDTLLSIEGVSGRMADAPGVPSFHYFVQHLDADGQISYTTLDEQTLAGFPREASVTVRPFPPTEVGDDDFDGIELVID